MTDEVNSPAPDTAPAQDATPAAPVESPQVETPTVESPTPAADTASLLGESPKIETPAEKPDEEKKPDSEGETTSPAEPKEDGSQSDEPAPLPPYEDFTLPEGVSLENEKLTQFTGMLGEFQNLTKAETPAVQAFGQKLVDMYVAETQETLSRVNKAYADAWEKQKSDWREEFAKDPEIGGNRQETTLKSALEFIRTHGGTADEQTEIRNLMNSTGVGNHKAMIRLLAKAQSAMSEGGPLPARAPVSQSRSKLATRYGNAG